MPELNASAAANAQKLADLSRNTGEISRSFMDGSIAGAPIWLILSVVGFLLAVLAALSLLRAYRAGRHKFIPAGFIASPRQIRQLLGEALAQRSVMEVQMLYDLHRAGRILRLSIHEISRGNIYIAADDLKNAAARWTGRAVNCYFKVRIKDQPVYYNFESAVKEVQAGPGGQALLVLPLPEKLQNRQKRAFLRLEPPQEYLIGSAVWLGWHVPSDEALENIRNWSKPSLSLLPGRRSQFTLVNMSAGGLRLRVPRSELQDAGYDLHVSEQILVLLDLLDPETRKRLRLALTARVQYLTQDYQSKDTVAGLKFVAWAQPQDDGGSRLHWLRLTSDSEVAALGNWIVRRHLEMVRMLPEDELD